MNTVYECTAVSCARPVLYFHEMNVKVRGADELAIMHKGNTSGISEL